MGVDAPKTISASGGRFSMKDAGEMPDILQVTYAMVRTKSGGNRAISPEFVITGLIFYPSRVES
jgi:hypothetical protein